MFPSPVLEKVLCVPKTNTMKGFYMFPSPVLEKGSIGSSVQYCVKVVYVFSSSKLEKGSMFTSPVLEKGSIVFPVQDWEKDLGSPNQY